MFCYVMAGMYPGDVSTKPESAGASFGPDGETTDFGLAPAGTLLQEWRMFGSQLLNFFFIDFFFLCALFAFLLAYPFKLKKDVC